VSRPAPPAREICDADDIEAVARMTVSIKFSLKEAINSVDGFPPNRRAMSQDPKDD
jgi:hypothetical protein